MKRKQSTITLFCSLVMVLAMVPAAIGELPQIMTYQGVLADSDGRPLDGSYDITAKLYTAPAGTTAIWTETHTGVAVGKGVFAVMLGRYTSLALLNFDQRLWLGISVNQGTEMEPRVELATVATAFLAKTVVDKSITVNKIADQQIVKSINGGTDNLNIIGEGDVVVERNNETITVRLKQCDWEGWGDWNREFCTDNGCGCTMGKRRKNLCENYRITNTEEEEGCVECPPSSDCS